MDAIEPNLAALATFAAAAFVWALALVVMLGMFPLAARPPATRGPIGMGLIAVNLVLLAIVLAVVGLYGWVELRWTSLAVVAGFAFLFAPALFQIWPERWRDSRLGLILVAAGQTVAVSGIAFAPRAV